MVPPASNHNRTLFLHSLWIGSGSAAAAIALRRVGFLASIGPMSGGEVLSDTELVPLIAPSLEAVLLPILCTGIAWVELSVPSTFWRRTVPLLLVTQLLAGAALGMLYGTPFATSAPITAVLLACGLGGFVRSNRNASALPAGENKSAEKTHAPRATPAPPPTPIAAPSSASAPPTPPAPKPAIQPARRENCTVLHIEVLNYTQLAEHLIPEDFTLYLNRFLAIANETASARGGLTDRADSEAFRAIFPPHPEGEPHSRAALHAAVAIRARLQSLSRHCEVRHGIEVDARIGVNSGEMLLAAFGEPGRVRPGAAGEPAEWAGRLAGANLLYGTRILIGARTSELAGTSVESRSIDLLQRKLPPSPPEEVFELLGLEGTLDNESLDRLAHYREGVAHLRARNWKAARTALLAARPIGQTDDAVDLLLHRIGEQEALSPSPSSEPKARPAQ